MDRMTVGRLKSILVNFNDNDIVYIFGGEDGSGGFAYLNICHDENDVINEMGSTILEYED